MSFRGRLRLFFALIVIVPMTALGVVIFALTERTETGKADAGLGTAARTALALHRDQVNAARPAVRRVAADSRLRLAIVRGRISAARRRMRALVRGDVIAIELWSRPGRRLVQVGSDAAVAWRGSELVRRGGGSSATLFLSVTHAGALARRIEHLTELQVAVFRGRRRLASTLRPAGDLSAPPPGGSADIDVAEHSYRGRRVRFDELAGAPVDLAILRPAAPLAEHIADDGLLIAGVLTLFVLLALASATFVSRALTGQIATLLAAARRLSRGDFQKLVPVEGNDEFAELGREFNDMSEQLEAKIDEVERKRQELEETIRRVGDALATGLDRHGEPFTREEEELLEYLAGQAVVSIENASLHETVERQAVTDELTGLANVRAFMSTLDREIERRRRFEHPVGLVLIDLDDFKRVNDTYGHQQGDEVLAHVAWVLRDASRDLDTVARYGGEELAVVLPQTDASGAAKLAERMRHAIESLHVPRVDGSGTIDVTASFGVASVPDNAHDRNELIAAADAALYAAKAAGKNRVERAGMPVAEPSS